MKGIIRGHGAPVNAAHMLKNGKSLLTIDAHGAAMITHMTGMNMSGIEMRHGLDIGGLAAVAYERLWKPYGKPLADLALHATAQVLPLNNAATPFMEKLSALIPLNMSGGEKIKPGRIFRDCEACPEMITIKPGSFIMGSPLFESGRDSDEGPRRLVTIEKPFAVGRFEVTFDEWDACVKDGGCGGYSPKDENWGRGKRPVMNVSWDDVKTYIAWLNANVPGKPYRLLSEAEWEFAVRAGTQTVFSTGNRISAAQANYDGSVVYNGSEKGDYLQRTVPVGNYPPNAFGVYDMHGNVWEWVEDCYGSYNEAPTDGSAKAIGKCKNRVVRGGSWYSVPQNLRSANRDWIPPEYRNVDIGFRIARTLTP